MNPFKRSLLFSLFFTLNIVWNGSLWASLDPNEGVHLSRCADALTESAIPLTTSRSQSEVEKPNLSPKWQRQVAKAYRWTARWAQDHFVSPSPDLDVYDLKRRILGRGYSGVIYEGTLPSDYLTRYETPEDHWQSQTTKVVIKVSRPQSIHRLTLENEGQMSQRLNAVDVDHLFLRYHLDQYTGVLVSTKIENVVTLEEWAKKNKQKTFEALAQIETQLNRALDVLKAAQLVHSDLSLQNILINPKTLQITIIDYGIMAEVGSFAFQRKELSQNKRGGIFKSANQQADRPAQFEDDEFAVQAILNLLSRRD